MQNKLLELHPLSLSLSTLSLIAQYHKTNTKQDSNKIFVHDFTLFWQYGEKSESQNLLKYDQKV